MYKLLTDKERAKVEGEYRSRRANAALLLAHFLLAFTVVAFLPSLILTLGQRNAAAVLRASAAVSGAHSDSAQLMSWAKAERQKLTTLAPTPVPTPYEYFVKLLSTKTGSIKLTSFAYTKTGNTLTANGVAADRQALLDFQTKLAASGDYTKVDFPVNNLTKDKDINFQLSLVLH